MLAVAMFKLLLRISIPQFVHGTCPSGAQLVRNGECSYQVNYGISLYYDEATDISVSKCQAINGQTVIIHDEGHQSDWQSRQNQNLLIGLTCNTVTKRWEWVDGSAIDFKPPTGSYDKELDQDCESGCVWYISRDKFWEHLCGHTSYSFDLWCTIEQSPPSAKECDNFDDDSEDSACYQIGVTVANWQDAQMECRNYGADLASIHDIQENSFIRRLAVSKGSVNGVYLGATVSGKGTGFGWIDGSAWDYENFFPGFPIDGLGDCLSMDTLGTTGQWMNMDCSTKQAVACIRKPNSSYIDECSSGPWKEGQIIYSPGYPYDASVPCEYFLTVDTGKKLEVKIQLLEANMCCDNLILSDSYLGGNIVANLTGEISSKTYTTKSSNLMRVSWQPNGGVNVRGFMMSYRAV